MASNYPAALDNFTDKTDGFDDVMAAHVNDLQHAVSAVQTTLGINPQGSAETVADALSGIDAVSQLLRSGDSAQKLVADSGQPAGACYIDDDFGVSVLFGDGINALEAGFKGFAHVPYDCVIEAVALAADAAGSFVVDIWKGALAALPTAANSICASSKPALASAQVVEDALLAGWNVQLAKGDVLAFHVESADGVKLVMLSITGRKTAVR